MCDLPHTEGWIDPRKYEPVINPKTAKTMDLEVSPSLLAGANEVIE